MVGDGIAALFHQPLWRAGGSADANSADSLQPSGVDFLRTLDKVAVWIYAVALAEEHFAIAALASADKEDEVVACGKLGDVRHTVGYRAADGVEASERSCGCDVPTGLLGSKDVTLAYIDEHDCKAVNVSHSIVVNHTDAPTPISNSDSKLNVVNQAAVPLLSADGADDATYKWYLENDTTTTVEAQTQTYQIGFVPDTDGKMKEGQYSAYVTQTVNGCQSVPAQAILTITDCPVTSPTAPKYFACVGQNGIDVTAVSTYANPESDDSKTIGWFWDNTKIPVTTVASLAAAQPDGTGATFSISSDKLNDAGNVTIYVAEYDASSGKECFSPAIPVTVEVHANPQPTITVPDVICSTEQQIDVPPVLSSRGRGRRRHEAHGGGRRDRRLADGAARRVQHVHRGRRHLGGDHGVERRAPHDARQRVQDHGRNAAQAAGSPQPADGAVRLGHNHGHASGRVCAGFLKLVGSW